MGAHLDGTGVGLDVDDISDGDALLLDAFVDARVEAELLRALDRFERDDDVRDRLAVARERVLRLGRSELRHLALVDLLRLLHAQPCGPVTRASAARLDTTCASLGHHIQLPGKLASLAVSSGAAPSRNGRLTNRAPKVLHEDLRLLDLGAVDLASDHRAEGDFRAELLGNGER